MSRQINLFNPQFTAQRKVFSTVAMARALAVLAAGCMVLALVGQRNSASLAQDAAAAAARLAQKQAKLEQVALAYAPRERDRALDAELAALEARLLLLRQASVSMSKGELGNTQGYAGAFRALARQSSGGLWLTGVEMEGALERISLEGRALDAALVPAYLSRLGSEALLQGKHFDSLRIGASKDNGAAAAGGVVEFSVSAAPAEPATAVATSAAAADSVEKGQP